MEEYVSNVLAVKLKQAPKMHNRPFFERVIIWDKFMSMFTAVTSKSHFSQIEFLFQASSSKNSLTNLGENGKTYYFFLEVSSFNRITLQKIFKNSFKKTFKS